MKNFVLFFFCFTGLYVRFSSHFLTIRNSTIKMLFWNNLLLSITSYWIIQFNNEFVFGFCKNFVNLIIYVSELVFFTKFNSSTFGKSGVSCMYKVYWCLVNHLNFIFLFFFFKFVVESRPDIHTFCKWMPTSSPCTWVPLFKLNFTGLIHNFNAS